MRDIVLAVGTYDGVVAGWQLDDSTNQLKLTFASPVHAGSIRALRMSRSTLLSCGYDEYLKTHDWSRRLTSSGEIRTPSDMGTPVCAAFAAGTHAVVGFGGNGKICIYKRKDWSIQHVLSGHQGGTEALAVHPTGKMCLSGGATDGKLQLWDLVKGRLAYASKIVKTESSRRTQAITSIQWSEDGSCYAYCHGSHLTVRDVATGKELLDIELETRINEICLMTVAEGLFVVAACNDGSLPVLAVQAVDNDSDVRRAIMAIEPVEGPVAGEERFKCICHVDGYLVATANSAGVVSLMDLSGAVRMVLHDDQEQPVKSDDEGDNDSKDSEEAAVEIIDSVQLGSGARITCLVASIAAVDESTPEEIDEPEDENESMSPKQRLNEDVNESDNGHKRKRPEDKVREMDPEALARARKLVADAKKIQKKKEKKKRRQSSSVFDSR